MAHDPTISPSFIVSRFIDGLKHEIKSIVIIQRPSSLDTACSLAMLQEEVLMGFSRKDTRRYDLSPSFKSSSPNHSVGSFNSFRPPLLVTAPDDRKAIDNSKTVSLRKVVCYLKLSSS